MGANREYPVSFNEVTVMSPDVTMPMMVVVAPMLPMVMAEVLLTPMVIGSVFFESMFDAYNIFFIMTLSGIVATSMALSR